MSDKSLRPNPRLNTVGRGASSNPKNRFEEQALETDLSDYGWFDEDEDVSSVTTQFFSDHSKSIIAENDSPDIPFRYSMNFYRGCEHGCSYCYARPTHEYLGLSGGLDFESKIFVKEKAPELLRERLMMRSWSPEPINISGVTDCYQPAERKYQLTRKCLEVLLEFRNPATLITKNKMILRDLDILKELNQFNLVFAMLSITTLDTKLARELEPRTSSPSSRLAAVEQLAKVGIPVGVNFAPVIPGLTDHEMPNILKAAAAAGAKIAGYVPLRLPLAAQTVFLNWIETHRPENKDRVVHYLQELRGGKLNDPNFTSRMQGRGPRAESMKQLFDIFTRKYKLNEIEVNLSKEHFRRPGDQLTFF